MKITASRRNQAADSTQLSTPSLLRCPSCKTENTPNATQCRHCGAWLFETAKCGLCSQIISTRIDHCTYCRVALAASNLEPYTPLTRQRGRRSNQTSNILLVSLAVNVLVMVALGCIEVTGHANGLVNLALSLSTVVLVWVGAAALLRWNTRVAKEDGVDFLDIPPSPY